jgi:hypothetical protein
VRLAQQTDLDRRQMDGLAQPARQRLPAARLGSRAVSWASGMSGRRSISSVAEPSASIASRRAADRA